MWSLVLAGFLTAVLTVVLFYALAIEPRWLRIRHRVLYLQGWDPSLDGITVLHLSDFHIGRSNRRLVRLLERARHIRADIVVITGDFVDGPDGVAQIESVLRPLTQRHTVLGVPGNHDHRVHELQKPDRLRRRRGRTVDSSRVVVEALRAVGVTMLVNSSSAVRFERGSITFAGIDDSFTYADDWEAALRDVADRDSVILLAHSPDAHAQAAAEGIPLVLSGHTHGGQVRIGPWFTPTTGTRKPLERPSGVIAKGRTLIHISPGLGISGPPIRFFARPEATVLELRGINARTGE